MLVLSRKRAIKQTEGASIEAYPLIFIVLVPRWSVASKMWH